MQEIQTALLHSRLAAAEDSRLRNAMHGSAVCPKLYLAVNPLWL